MPFVYPDNSINTDYFTDNNASGGEGGRSFEFIKLDQGAILTRIKAWKNDWRIRGVQVWMSDLSTKMVGTRDGTSSEFKFQDGELIESLNVQASDAQSSVLSRRRLGGIWLKTNKGRFWAIYSDDLEDDGQYWPDVGSGMCCGIFGASGDAVDRLGFAMLRPIERAMLVDVKYPHLDMEIVASTPDTVARQVFKNSTGADQKFILKGSKTVTIMREWGLTVGLSMTVNASVTAGIPKVAEVTAGFSWTVSTSASYKASTSTTESKSWEWPLVCPSKRQVIGKATLYADDIDTDYEGTMELKLSNQKIYRYTIKGVYSGMNTRSGTLTMDDLGPYNG